MSRDSTDVFEFGRNPEGDICNGPMVALSDFKQWMHTMLPVDELSESELVECRLVECLVNQIEAHFIAHVVYG